MKTSFNFLLLSMWSLGSKSQQVQPDGCQRGVKYVQKVKAKKRYKPPFINNNNNNNNKNNNNNPWLV